MAGPDGVNKSSGRDPYTLAIVSGKGGVGKTNTACNLAIQFASLGKRVLLFDADLGLASVDVLLGLVPRFTIQQVLDGQCSCLDALLEGPNGISILPACSGIPEMAELQPAKLQQLVDGLADLTRRYDIVIIDAPSGIASNMLRVAAIADEILLLTTPEPTAAMDAYAVAKIFSTRRPNVPLRLWVNMISEHDAGERIVAGFHEVMSRFLSRRIEIL
ncbi:MAG: P-loop NTPase, partial [Planctomycetota bacterium]